MTSSKRPNARKLLTASLGVAAISYLGTTSCGGKSVMNDPEGNGSGAAAGSGAASSGAAAGIGGGFTSGNLMPPLTGGGGPTNPPGIGGEFTSGNLMPPPTEICDETDNLGGEGGQSQPDTCSDLIR